MTAKQARDLSNNIIDSIASIEIFMHRITIYSKYVSYPELKKLLDIRQSLRPLTQCGDEISDFYTKALNLTIMGCKAKVIAAPKEKYWALKKAPWWKLLLTYPTPELLHYLVSILPDVIVTEAEVTTDFMCTNPDDAARLFWLLRKNVYIGRGANVSHQGGKINGVRDLLGPILRKENAVYEIHDESNEVIATIYERGPDNKAQKHNGRPWWRHKDVDRARWEFKFDKEKSHDKTFKVYGLLDMLGGNAFTRIIGSLFQLRIFNTGIELPRYWEEYEEKDEAGFGESFQLEWIRANDRGINTSKCATHAPHLRRLVRKVLKAAAEADNRHNLTGIEGIST